MPFTLENIDLFGDWAKIAKTKLETLGFVVNTENPDEISIKYYNYLKRNLKKIPRNVLLADDFLCPSDLEPGLKLLVEKIQHGEELRPHLSTKLKNLDEDDDLLYDWDIFHFHLGTTIRDDGFINRTDPLLFARFDEKNAYLINILLHGAWTNSDMVRSLYRNWPKSIEEFYMSDIIEVEKRFNDDQISDLRDGHFNTIVEVETGKFYVPIGGGFLANGKSIHALQKHLRYKEGLREIEEFIKKNLEGFLIRFGFNVDRFGTSNLKFKIINVGSELYISEVNNNQSIRLLHNI